MRTQTLGFLFAAALLAATLPAAAQSRAGIGLAVARTTAFANLGGGGTTVDVTNMTFPIIGPNVKVEPEFGMFSLTQSQNSSSATSSNLRVGSSFCGGRVGENLAGWFGVTGGFIRSALSFDGPGAPDDDDEWDWYVGPIASAEYFFNPHLSLAGKVGVTWTFFGNTGSTDVTMMSTLNALTVGFYF